MALWPSGLIAHQGRHRLILTCCCIGCTVAKDGTAEDKQECITPVAPASPSGGVVSSQRIKHFHLLQKTTSWVSLIWKNGSLCSIGRSWNKAGWFVVPDRWGGFLSFPGDGGLRGPGRTQWGATECSGGERGPIGRSGPEEKEWLMTRLARAILKQVCLTWTVEVFTSKSFIKTVLWTVTLCYWEFVGTTNTKKEKVIKQQLGWRVGEKLGSGADGDNQGRRSSLRKTRTAGSQKESSSHSVCRPKGLVFKICHYENVENANTKGKAVLQS